jgi:excisionase family DNA binding protein
MLPKTKKPAIPLPVEQTATALPEIMTIREVAEFLRMSQRNVVTQAEHGAIPGTKIGSLWRFSRKALEGMFSGSHSGDGLPPYVADTLEPPRNNDSPRSGTPRLPETRSRMRQA